MTRPTPIILKDSVPNNPPISVNRPGAVATRSDLFEVVSARANSHAVSEVQPPLLCRHHTRPW